MIDVNQVTGAQHLILSKCPLCYSNIRPLGITESYDIPSSVKKINIDYGVCESCSFVMQINPLTGESIRAYYENSPRFRSPDLSPTEEQLCLNQVAFMAESGNLSNASVLDIGADMGKLLTFLKSMHGCITSYQEHSEYALAYLREHTTHHEIDDLKETDIFDWIVLSQVLEHIVDPVSFLQNMQSNLSEKGSIYIEVPNHSFWDKNDYGFSFEHVNYFSVGTFVSALDRAGFVIKRLSVTSDLRYFNGKYRIIRATAVKRGNWSLKEIDERVKEHNRNLLGDSLVGIEKLAIESYSSSKQPVGLYAAGELLKLFFERSPHIAPESIVVFDSDTKKQGKYINGILIRNPEEIVTLNPTSVVILSSAEADIRKRIQAMGYTGKVFSFDQAAKA